MPVSEKESKGQNSEEKRRNWKGNYEGTQSQGRASPLQPEVESGAHSEDRNDTSLNHMHTTEDWNNMSLLSASERQFPLSLQGKWMGTVKVRWWGAQF